MIKFKSKNYSIVPPTTFTKKKNENLWKTGNDSRLHKFWVNFTLAKSIEGTVPRDIKIKINNALHLRAYNFKNAFTYIISFMQFEIMVFILMPFFLDHFELLSSEVKQ